MSKFSAGQAVVKLMIDGGQVGPALKAFNQQVKDAVAEAGKAVGGAGGGGVLSGGANIAQRLSGITSGPMATLGKLGAAGMILKASKEVADVAVAGIMEVDRARAAGDVYAAESAKKTDAVSKGLMRESRKSHGALGDTLMGFRDRRSDSLQQINDETTAKLLELDKRSTWEDAKAWVTGDIQRGEVERTGNRRVAETNRQFDQAEKAAVDAARSESRFSKGRMAAMQLEGASQMDALEKVRREQMKLTIDRMPDGIAGSTAAEAKRVAQDEENKHQETANVLIARARARAEISAQQEINASRRAGLTGETLMHKAEEDRIEESRAKIDQMPEGQEKQNARGVHQAMRLEIDNARVMRAQDREVAHREYMDDQKRAGLEGLEAVRAQERDKLAAIRERQKLEAVRNPAEAARLKDEADALEKANAERDKLRTRDVREGAEFGIMDVQEELATNDAARAAIGRQRLDKEREVATRGLSKEEKAAVDEYYDYRDRASARFYANEAIRTRAILREADDALMQMQLRMVSLGDIGRSVGQFAATQQTLDLVARMLPELANRIGRN